MRAPVIVLTAAVVAAMLLAGCKIDSTVYVPPGGDDDDGDAGQDDGATDAAPQGIYVVVTPSTTTVSEGGQAIVRVKLSEAPPTDRTIAITGTTLLTPTPASLTFTPDNWNVERTIILAAAQDDDADDSPVTVLFDGGGQVADGTAMVMITDDDQQLLVVTPPSSIGVTEGSTGQVEVQLAARPSSSVVVSVTSMDPAIATLSTASLSFTSASWDTPQPITVTGTQDVNTGNDSTLLVLDPASEGVPTHTLAINITDDDVLAIDASPGNLGTITEAAGAMHTATFGVRLTQMPGGNVIVAVAATPAAAVALSGATLSGGNLTFTTANYSTLQNVTVTASVDPNVVDEQVSIRLSAAGLADRFVQVSIDDADTQVIDVIPDPGPLAITEGAAANLTVRLRYEPAGAVIVDVGSGDPNVAAINVTQLTFGPSDYASPQTVRVTAVEDGDLASGSTTISCNAAAEGLTTNRTINVTDDDTQALVVAPTTIAVNEGGQNTFAVSLLFQPASSTTVTVTVPPGNNSDLAVAPGSLTFTPGDFDTAQAVTATALEDADATNEAVTITVASAGAPSRTVTANVADNDSVDIVVTPGVLDLIEDQPGSNIMVSLGAAPAGNVTVTVVTDPTGVASVSTPSLLFTAGNFNTPQAVLVTAIADGDGLDETTTIRLNAPALAEKTVAVSVTDDDVVAPVLTPNPHTIEEGKPDGIVQLTLSRDPGRAVTVDVPSFGFTDFEVTPQTYQFEVGQWNVGQTVNLFASEDDTADVGETESAVFQIVSEGTQTILNVNITDPTVLLGFPPPLETTPAGLTGLEAFKDGVMPQCFLVEKMVVEVATATDINSRIAVGLYAHGATTMRPDALLWTSGTIFIGAGSGRREIDVVDTQIYSVSGAATTWLAVEATALVTLRTKSPNTDRCVRAHGFGDFMPNPYSASGTGGGSMALFDGGVDAGNVNVTCNTAPPVAVWLIGKSTSCIAAP